MARQDLINPDDEEAWNFNDVGHEGTCSEELSREWSSRHARFHTLGYRDGIEEGKRSSVQQGFDVGYAQGVEAGQICGLARGWAGAFMSLPESIQCLLLDDSARIELNEAQSALTRVSSDTAAQYFYQSISGLDKSELDDMAEDGSGGNKPSGLQPEPSVDVVALKMKLEAILMSKGVIQ
ncbi:hypothetical protein KP509_26G050700 [Ceratopteris richardii]|uniref:Essential protein Yae1 N-terminal domain-containing protein n=1 Tax=Ceratopteris richardii TaxID=49495 RepID=A0A8T2RMM1_CERRI|nr:hypothetical protein KP509_26G050700 [Ceratopteris richardii]